MSYQVPLGYVPFSSSGEQDVSAKTFRQKKFETFRQIFFAETSAAMFLPKRPVPFSDMSPFPLVSDDPIIYDYSIYYSICYNQSIIVFYNSFIKTELREWTNLFKIN